MGHGNGCAIVIPQGGNGAYVHTWMHERPPAIESDTAL